MGFLEIRVMWGSLGPFNTYNLLGICSISSKVQPFRNPTRMSNNFENGLLEISFGELIKRPWMLVLIKLANLSFKVTKLNWYTNSNAYFVESELQSHFWNLNVWCMSFFKIFTMEWPNKKNLCGDLLFLYVKYPYRSLSLFWIFNCSVLSLWETQLEMVLDHFFPA